MSSSNVKPPEPIKPTDPTKPNSNKGPSSALNKFRSAGTAVISGLPPPPLNRSKKIFMPPIGAVSTAKAALFNAFERAQQRVSGRLPLKLPVNISALKAPFNRSPVSNVPNLLKSNANPNLYANNLTNLLPTATGNPKYEIMSGPVYSEVGPPSGSRTTRQTTDPLPEIPKTGINKIPEGYYMSINNNVRQRINPQGLYQSLNNVTGTLPKKTNNNPHFFALRSVNNTTPIMPPNKYKRQYFNKTLKQFRKNSSLNLANTNKITLFRRIATNARIRNMPINQKVNLIRKLTGKQRFKVGKIGFGSRKLSNNNSKLAQQAAEESITKLNPIFNGGESSSDPTQVIKVAEALYGNESNI